MSRSLTLELFAPTGQVTRARAALTVDALLASGFAPERAPGAGVEYWVGPDLDWHEAPGPTEAWAAFDRAAAHAAGWSLKLWKRRLDGELIDLLVGFRRAPGDEQQPFDRVTLSMYIPRGWPQPEQGALVFREFLGWATLVAGLNHLWYAWGGSDEGLFDLTPISPLALLALAPQPLQWLNIYGPGYVERLGLGRLLATPAWQVALLADGSVAVVLCPQPDDVTVEEGRRVADYLGIPGPP